MKSSIEVVMLPHLVDIIEVESKPLVGRELHGFTKPVGFATGFSGVRVGVQNFVPQRNPYP